MKIVVAYGTRPEEIKLEPVVRALRERGADVRMWFSGQSPDLASKAEKGALETRWDLGLHAGIKGVIDEFTNFIWFGFRADEKPNAVIVQGDTATAFACALAAWLQRVPVAHVEAGLRTYGPEPFPEEGFRRMITAMARWHFCPDVDAALNVLREIGQEIWTREVCEDAWFSFRTPDETWGQFFARNFDVFVVGNTIIDTLPREPFRVLVTLHRRENWGRRIREAIDRLESFASDNPEVEVTIVKHPNWKVWGGQDLEGRANVRYIEPIQDHGEFLEKLRGADVVVTDSGGLQEEAAYFGIPCLVVRKYTERVALLRNGAVRLVDPDDPEELRYALDVLLDGRRAYGDGRAGERIAEILVKEIEA
jgi:UDP-N-acetylglucosamine 2-epimerase (non-hydrolysing)